MSIRVITRDGVKYEYPRGESYVDVTQEGNLDIHHGHDYDGDEVADEHTLLATFAGASWEVVEFYDYDSELDEDDE